MKNVTPVAAATLCVLFFATAGKVSAEVSVTLSEDNPSSSSSSTTHPTEHQDPHLDPIIPPDPHDTPHTDTHGCYGSVSVRSINGCTVTDYCADASTGTHAEYAARHNAGVDDVITGPGASLNCLDQIRRDCGNDGKVHITVKADGSSDSLATTDDCIYGKLFTSENMNNLPGSPWNRVANEAGVETLATFQTYLDSSCQPMKDPPVDQICDNFNVMVSVLASPISLIWRGGVNAIPVAVTNFPLDPAQKGKWFGWEASTDAPLLVFDPEHNGNITSSSQLFGNFSFGKKWKDGYEALASLDTNHDQKLSGEELAPLGIWFDKNQNGISEQGEVFPAVSAGLKVLYVTPGKVEQDTGRIVTALGYEATVDGKKVTGGSVDWFSNGYDTQMAAVTALKDRADQLARNRTGGRENKLVKNSKNPASGALAGLWSWRSGADHEKFGPKGMLSFVEKQGTVIGHSLVEVPMRRNPFGMSSYVVANPLKATSSIQSDGTTKISFMVTAKNGSVTASEGLISADHQHMKGISKVELSRNDTGQTRVLTYDWVATRLP